LTVLTHCNTGGGVGSCWGADGGPGGRMGGESSTFIL
jgi:hypothetical protein